MIDGGMMVFKMHENEIIQIETDEGDDGNSYKWLYENLKHIPKLHKVGCDKSFPFFY
jgi:hypothetical protein